MKTLSAVLVFIFFFTDNMKYYFYMSILFSLIQTDGIKMKKVGFWCIIKSNKIQILDEY